MIEHRRRTGTYRPEDLRRLLGDPNKSVEVGPESSLSSFLSAEGRLPPDSPHGLLRASGWGEGSFPIPPRLLAHHF